MKSKNKQEKPQGINFDIENLGCPFCEQRIDNKTFEKLNLKRINMIIRHIANFCKLPEDDNLYMIRKHPNNISKTLINLEK